MNIVFLDRDTLPARPLTFNFPHTLREYPATAPEELNQRLAGAQIAITNKVSIRAEHLAANPQLKLIAVAATGFDHIDVAAAKAAGVTVCNVRNYSSESVAQHAFMMLLALIRHLPACMRDIAAGAWQQSPQFVHFNAPMHDLGGKTLAIFGRGNIGRTLAGYAQAFGMHVLWGEHKNAATVREVYTPFQAALRQADAVSLHCPMTPDTRHMIGEAELRLMKPGAILINTGRGGLADEQAVFQALEQGRLGGAGFDVLSQEPPRQGNPLLASLPNLIVTPHIAWTSQEALLNMTEILEANINAFAAGRPQNAL
ncbi:D-2-hydroxyacid dehydrogenase [Eikenella sp. S3360]|uniref:D-2-hydroxyacid dehydrogenase n=1 Tax=Eikenella glucosivorans TaxID=2766967 RepID=A0ABS0N8K5_9NEIS|nr:D-2-hydroxyacid dehydrogenase [Eikenella glucosivorans]MBH5328615.1 D-2-hydroxyacid dehydrogenase [Eikenella glucosivorans]